MELVEKKLERRNEETFRDNSQKVFFYFSIPEFVEES